MTMENDLLQGSLVHVGVVQGLLGMVMGTIVVALLGGVVLLFGVGALVQDSGGGRRGGGADDALVARRSSKLAWCTSNNFVREQVSTKGLQPLCLQGLHRNGLRRQGTRRWGMSGPICLGGELGIIHVNRYPKELARRE